VASYPYSSSQASIFQAFAQLRKSFPSKVDADYLKRFGIAPANESYIIGILRFLDLIDDESGAQIDKNTDFFFGADEKFRAGLEGRLRDRYAQLFSEMGDDALTADKGDLAQWFRASDKTSELVGSRQATTFLSLAALAGHGPVPEAGSAQAKKPAEPSKAVKKPAKPKVAAKEIKSPLDDRNGGLVNANSSDVGLTVRIEVNLPPAGDNDTYDAIFASIKKHLMS
jgi:hypothetical protein